MSDQDQSTAESTDQKPPANGPIVARYGQYYRNTRYLIFAMFLGFGIWFAYDGFYKWPRQNADAIARGQKPPHGDYDIPLQKALAFILPPLAVVILYRALHNSRGEIRLDGETLSIPGHPPISLSSIRKIDKGLWDRKGIAYIEYELGEPPVRQSFKLDDFVYDRPPIDAIMDRIDAYAASVAPSADPSTSA